METRDLLRKVKRIEIRTRSLVEDVFAGEYHSVFKGRGVEFAEVREYVPGDDIRAIDWNVTARTSQPFVKVFEEERELTVMLLVDRSGSADFGSVDSSKGEIAAEISALLAFSAIKNNDKVGLIVFSDRVDKYVPPRKGKQHVLRVIRELLYTRPGGSGTDIAAAVEFLTRVLPRRAVVFLVSDFLGDGYRKAMRIAGRRHDLIAVVINDPRELAMVPAGLLELEDAETGETCTVDTGQARFAFGFERWRREGLARLARDLATDGIDRIDIRTDRPYVPPIVNFFRTRAHRQH